MKGIKLDNKRKALSEDPSLKKKLKKDKKDEEEEEQNEKQEKKDKKEKKDHLMLCKTMFAYGMLWAHQCCSIDETVDFSIPHPECGRIGFHFMNVRDRVNRELFQAAWVNASHSINTKDNGGFRPIDVMNEHCLYELIHALLLGVRDKKWSMSSIKIDWTKSQLPSLYIHPVVKLIKGANQANPYVRLLRDNRKEFEEYLQTLVFVDLPVDEYKDGTILKTLCSEVCDDNDYSKYRLPTIRMVMWLSPWEISLKPDLEYPNYSSKILRSDIISIQNEIRLVTRQKLVSLFSEHLKVPVLYPIILMFLSSQLFEDKPIIS
jgi:hypothetical protein